jgi:hypothetical protein
VSASARNPAFHRRSALIEVLGQTGFNFVMLDCEHSGASPRSMEDLVRVSRLAGLAPSVPVPDPRVGADVRRPLEAGAEGILPEVHGVEDIEAAARAAFPAQGRSPHLPGDPRGGLQLRRVQRLRRVERPGDRAGAPDREPGRGG